MSKNFTFHTDTTFNIFTDDSQIIICGLTDFHRQFHPLGFLICRSETAASYKHLFKILFEQHSIHFKSPVLFSSVMTDAGTSVMSAVQDFEAPNKLCIFHVKQRILKNIKNSEERKTLIKYFDFLSWTKNEEIFNQCISRLERFIKDSFGEKKQEYLLNLLVNEQKWANIGKYFVPSTNNALESINKHLKDVLHTKYKKRISFAQGIPVLFDYLKQLSYKDFETRVLYSAHEKMIDSSLEHKTYFNSEKNVFVKLFKRRDEIKSLDQLYTAYKQPDIYCIDQAINFYSMCIFTEYSTEINSFCDLVCSCYDFSKKYKCEHVYSVLVEKNKENLIDSYFKPTVHKKRGRKTNKQIVYKENKTNK